MRVRSTEAFKYDVEEPWGINELVIYGLILMAVIIFIVIIRICKKRNDIEDFNESLISKHHMEDFG